MMEEKVNDVTQQGESQTGYKEGIVQIDPYTAQLLIIRSEMYIVYNYPHLITTNQKLMNEKVIEIIKEDAVIFVIKSFTEEDIHKAIKYNVWSSTNFGNNKLDSEYKLNRPVYLLFSTYKSNQFTGLAQMKSQVNFKNIFPLWARDSWRGTFDIEWLLIKDVPFKEFRGVKCEKKDKKLNGEYNFINYSTKSLSNSPDCQRIPSEEAKEIIQLMVDYQNKNSILEHFEYYDRRQANYEASLNLNTNSNLNNNSFGIGNLQLDDTTTNNFLNTNQKQIIS